MSDQSKKVALKKFTLKTSFILDGDEMYGIYTEKAVVDFAELTDQYKMCIAQAIDGYLIEAIDATKARVREIRDRDPKKFHFEVRIEDLTGPRDFALADLMESNSKVGLTMDFHIQRGVAIIDISDKEVTVNFVLVTNFELR